MNDKIPVNDNMPSDLRAAIEFVNSQAVNVDKNFDPDGDVELIDDEDVTNIDESALEVSDENYDDDSDDDDFDDNEDVSDLDSVF